MHSPKQPDKKESPFRAIGLVSAIGTDLALSVLGGVYLGKWADNHFGTSPAFLITGLFVGLAAGIYGMLLMIRRFQ
ncbi:AtpZ/AtpI family protein [Effusibacillus pohliae]|uniref:AtpZ/AtpI family protein n=1 Tax=Effusibacillus pohliae TaxID=232270 RepID=UPI000366D089|nr:AtpZ/AtpI family protein [Effusibacillus pohliae]